MPTFLNFWFPCILMGFGIAIDVTLATLAKFRDGDLSFRNWTSPITGTHVIFPAVGYYLFWGLSQTFPAVEMVLGLFGFTLVFLFVYEVVCNSAGLKPIFGISSYVSDLIGFDEDSTRRSLAILAVSWDALWSGPAKAAQALAGGWSTNEVIFSFLVAGLAVAVIAQLALYAAHRLRAVNFDNANSLARFNFYGKYVELSVIGGFGVLSLSQGFNLGLNLYQAILAAAVVLGIAFIALRAQLMANDLEEAGEAVEA